ncbi:hypothetical protein GMORB2_1653 [Geosmithia morbida]|uniref:Uncharacterized protein n=1 Tax=Geosmithia morbida TaxID=1094350 RepID=A0A9P4YUA4_9HYPO|nr:uncharacterized protein GMORB2_1653 [Geosmithia morbida]KAF4121813.1 hypothetical protein GMORB2_1653 [Geosmithia morbida]
MVIVLIRISDGSASSPENSAVDSTRRANVDAKHTVLSTVCFILPFHPRSPHSPPPSGDTVTPTPATPPPSSSMGASSSNVIINGGNDGDGHYFTPAIGRPSDPQPHAGEMVQTGQPPDLSGTDDRGTDAASSLSSPSTSSLNHAPTATNAASAASSPGPGTVDVRSPTTPTQTPSSAPSPSPSTLPALGTALVGPPSLQRSRPPTPRLSGLGDPGLGDPGLGLGRADLDQAIPAATLPWMADTISSQAMAVHPEPAPSPPRKDVDAPPAEQATATPTTAEASDKASDKTDSLRVATQSQHESSVYGEGILPSSPIIYDEVPNLSNPYSGSDSSAYEQAAAFQRLLRTDIRPPFDPGMYGHVKSTRNGRTLDGRDSADVRPQPGDEESYKAWSGKVQDLWRSLHAERHQASEIKRKMKNKRTVLEALRLKMNRADNDLMNSVRPVLTLRTELQDLDAGYIELEDALEEKEAELASVESRFFNLLKNPDVYDYDQDKPSSDQASGDESASAKCDRLPPELLGISPHRPVDEVHPLFSKLVLEVATLKVVEEAVDDMAEKKKNSDEVVGIRKSLGVSIPDGLDEFVANYPVHMATKRSEMARIQHRIRHFHQLCEARELVPRHISVQVAMALHIPTDVGEVPLPNEVAMPADGIMPAHPVFGRLLSRPSHLLSEPDPLTPQQALDKARALEVGSVTPAEKARRVNLARKEVDIDELVNRRVLREDEDMAGFIDRWLLFSLRTSVLEAIVLLSTILSEPGAGTVPQWQLAVLTRWYTDGATNFLREYMAADNVFAFHPTPGSGNGGDASNSKVRDDDGGSSSSNKVRDDDGGSSSSNGKVRENGQHDQKPASSRASRPKTASGGNGRLLFPRRIGVSRHRQRRNNFDAYAHRQTPRRGNSMYVGNKTGLAIGQGAF